MAWQLDLPKMVERAEWSVAGEIAVSLFLAALPLRIRLSFEIRVLCEAQSDAHSELTRHAQRRPRPRYRSRTARFLNHGGEHISKKLNPPRACGEVQFTFENFCGMAKPA